MKFKDNIVLITGSNGRIGTAVMQRLRKGFDNVVGFDREAATPPPPDCVAINVDITSDESVRDGLRILREHHGAKIAAVVHLAAYYDFLGKPSPKYDAITVEGTKRLLRGLRAGFEVEQFIFSSTMLVYRPGEPGVFITEDSPIEPTWAYPESKVNTEALIRAEHGAIPTVLLRFAGVYDDVCHSPSLAHQMQRIYERQLASHLYSGETSHGQAFIHLDDVVDAIERIVERRAKLPPESVLLIGEPQTLSYDELQHTFQWLIHGESWETYNVPGPIAKASAWLEDHMPGQDPFIKPWMIDRVTRRLGRKLFEVPVGFKWFADGLFDGSLGFGGEESAGASFLRRDGTVWTTDKDGIVPALLAAEIAAHMGRDPGERYRDLVRDLGDPCADRVEAPATAEQKARLAKLSPKQIKSTELAGEKIDSVLDHAPGNGAAIGGIKVTTASGWFAARPSGTEDIYKIYAESFRDQAHLQSLLHEAQDIVDVALETK